MCLAVPGQILAVDGKSARVDFCGVERMVLIDRGVLIASGTPEEIRDFDHPRVRQFLAREPDPDDRDEADTLRTLLGI